MPKPSTIRTLLAATIWVFLTCAVSQAATNPGYLSIDGDRIYYEISGDGYPLVLVSGGSGMDLRQWAAVVPELAAQFRVIAYDPRGIGRSDNPSVAYSDTRDLALLLDHLDLAQVGLLGTSSAGGLVLQFATEYPQRVAGLVATAPFVPGFEFSESMLTRLDGFNRAAEQGREPFLDAMFDDPHFLPSPLDASVRPLARGNMAENFDKGSDFDPSLPMPVDPPLIERLGAVDSPVLLLVGELDHSEVKRRNALLLDEISGAQEKVIARAGHNVPLENPQAYLAAAIPFLHGITD